METLGLRARTYSPEYESCFPGRPGRLGIITLELTNDWWIEERGDTPRASAVWKILRRKDEDSLRSRERWASV